MGTEKRTSHKFVGRVSKSNSSMNPGMPLCVMWMRVLKGDEVIRVYVGGCVCGCGHAWGRVRANVFASCLVELMYLYLA